MFFLVPLIIIAAISGDSEDSNTGNGISNIENLTAEQYEFQYQKYDFLPAPVPHLSDCQTL